MRGIHGANCRHSHGAGDGEHNPFKEYDSEENRKQYEMEQRQRTMERRIRKTKREVMNYRTAMENAQTDELRAAAEAKYQRKAVALQQQNKAYNQFCEETGLKKQSDRISIAKWDRSEAAKATAAAAKREKNLQFIEQDVTIKATSNSPKKLTGRPDEIFPHTVEVEVQPAESGAFEFHAVTPKGATLTKVEVMAGDGTSTPIRDLRRLYETYGLNAAGWQKKSGTVYGKEYHYVIHWYENNGNIPEDEIKLKGMKKNK